MADDPGTREAVAQLRSDLRDDFAAVHTRLDTLVSRELHEAQLARLGDRVDVVRDRADAVRADLDRLVAAIETDRRAAADRRATDRRMVIGSVIAAVLSVVVQIIMRSGAA